jgi:hypothetical protein
MLIRRFACRAIAVAALAAAVAVAAQTPGEWRYTIATDPSTLPTDMRVNFPTITFAVCRSADDFASGRAFALQTLASSAARCPSAGFVRTPGSAGTGERLSFVYACDEGRTLSGTAQGHVQATRFSVALESRYLPVVNGVDVVRQTMSAVRVGPCRVKPDADDLKVR